MLLTTEIIVLALLPHTDKARILHAYTRERGRTNFMVYGLGRKRPAGLYTPLSRLSVTADFPPENSNRPPVLREAAPSEDRSLTQNDNPYAAAVALFLSEVLFHVLRHPMPDEQLFDFIGSELKRLGEFSSAKGQELANFHLHFLIGLAARLGYAFPDSLPADALSRSQRQQQLLRICAFYAEHVETWQMPQSLDVFMEVFDA